MLNFISKLCLYFAAKKKKKEKINLVLTRCPRIENQ